MLSNLSVAFVDAIVVIFPLTLSLLLLLCCCCFCCYFYFKTNEVPLQYSELLWINWKVNMRTHNDPPVGLFESLQQKRELSIVCSGLRQTSKFAMIVHFFAKQHSVGNKRGILWTRPEFRIYHFLLLQNHQQSLRFLLNTEAILHSNMSPFFPSYKRSQV